MPDAQLPDEVEQPFGQRRRLGDKTIAVRGDVPSLADLDVLARQIEASPRPIDTGILEAMISEEAAMTFKEERVADNPMGRFGTPEELALGATVLAVAATYTTSAEFLVDGGTTQPDRFGPLRPLVLLSAGTMASLRPPSATDATRGSLDTSPPDCRCPESRGCRPPRPTAG